MHQINLSIRYIYLTKTAGFGGWEFDGLYYDSQRYSLEDNIVVRFPKLIKAATEKAECVREDMKTVDKGLLTAF